MNRNESFLSFLTSFSFLCKTKNKTIVEYTLRESSKPIGVAQYRIVKTLPDEILSLANAQQFSVNTQ